jgi:hypothetical protein
VLSLLDRLPVRHKILRIGLMNPAQIERLTNQKPNPPPLYMYVIASPFASALSTYINRVYKTEWVPTFISLCYCQTNDFLVKTFNVYPTSGDTTDLHRWRRVAKHEIQ